MPGGSEHERNEADCEGLIIALISPIFGWITSAWCASNVAAIDAGQVKATIKRVGDWQLAHRVKYSTLHWVVHWRIFRCDHLVPVSSLFL